MRIIGVAYIRAEPPPFGNVTDQGQYLGRLVNRDVAELPGRTVEPADRGMLEAAHGSDLRGLQALGAGELRQSRDSSPGSHTTT